MTTKATQLISEARASETRTPVYVFYIIPVFAAGFIYMMYRAALLIGSSAVKIDTKSYFMTHLLTALLEIILWVVIAMAAVRLKSYARYVINSDDGKALDYIANGLLLSLLYAIFFGMASTAKTLFINTTYLKPITTFTNLLPIAVILLSTVCLFIGTQNLRRIPLSKSHSEHKLAISLYSLLYIAVIVAYVIYFYHVAPRLMDDDGLHHFVLSARTLLAVYVAPYVIVWILGLLACLNLARYAHQVVGKIYKPLFRDLYIGLVMSYIGTYLVQIFYVSNLSSNSFGVGLIVVIALLTLLIYGCLRIYRGTNQLYLLEK